MRRQKSALFGLGTGIYFFAKREEAEIWAESEVGKEKNRGKEPCVLQADIYCKNTEFFDLDIKENMIQLEKTVGPYLLNGKNGHAVIEGKNADIKLRCLACNFYKKLKGIKIFAYTFPRIRNNRIEFPFCLQQRQYAVSDNQNIREIKAISMGGNRNERQRP